MDQLKEIKAAYDEARRASRVGGFSGPVAAQGEFYRQVGLILNGPQTAIPWPRGNVTRVPITSRSERGRTDESSITRLLDR